MKLFELGLTIRGKYYYLVYDKDYGIDKQSGWSLSVDGAYLSQLNLSLVKTLWLGLLERRRED